MRILEVVGLTKRFAGLTALDAVSFTAEEGQILGLFGASGAGKTTCFHCLSGFLTPDSGRIIFDGREVTGDPPHRLARAGLARVFRIVQPFRRLSALDNVVLALGYRHGWALNILLSIWHGEATRRRALGVLERVGLAAHADHPAALLSAGLQRRLELARALALGPRLILLDEPFDGLSDEERQSLAEVIARLRAEKLTLVLIERPLELAMALADRVVVLDHGALIASGPPERVRRDPRVIDAYQETGARATARDGSG